MRYPVLRPPYIYRWAVLITVLASAVTLTVTALGSGATGSPSTPVASPAPLPTTSEVEPVPADLVRTAAGTGRVVALTFDDGPHPEYTPQVLALLAQYGAVATFCIVGSEAERHPAVVQSVVAAGMSLCAHTMTHDGNLPARSNGTMAAEVAGSRDAVLRAAGDGAVVPWFRAPAGNWSQRVQEMAASEGMKPLSWMVDSRDWQRPGAEQILATVQAAVQPGAVILLHDGGGRRDQTVAALTQLLPWLVDQGYGFALPA